MSGLSKHPSFDWTGPMDLRDAEWVEPHIREALDQYNECGRPLGDFLRCCIENNFTEACARADNINVLVLGAIAAYITDHIPSSKRGPDGYEHWIRHNLPLNSTTRTP